MKKYVFDSYALLAYLQNEPGADQIEAMINEAQDEAAQILISAVNLGEVAYIIARTAGTKKLNETMALLETLPIEAVIVNKEFALTAAKYKAQYSIAYADCFTLALGVQTDSEIVTGDPEFHKVSEQDRIIWLREKTRSQ
ncbi:type II toxin-antitoxin system VapC family toxin [Moorella sp. Hama-1]|uniref:type II toxin-antitoxin system VapC family toxin n=1 Tax=Moorella sp. Hama-1 TaxID=2138101 RepID=UPI000D658A5E|nr:type II toxin-antitoxin system VapC family toxin [Moorella sp. Hama-1]BCV22947.1 twitching motility protein PilT [Moorella sp. Hama-1]